MTNMADNDALVRELVTVREYAEEDGWGTLQLPVETIDIILAALRTPQPEPSDLTNEPSERRSDGAKAEPAQDEVERVARAICRANVEPGSVKSEAEIAAAVEYMWRDYMLDATAAIAAMRPESEREGIVVWLREDAVKTRNELRRLHSNKKLTPSQTAEWETLIELKSSVADAIERGDHLKEPRHAE